MSSRLFACFVECKQRYVWRRSTRIERKEACFIDERENAPFDVHVHTGLVLVHNIADFARILIRGAFSFFYIPLCLLLSDLKPRLARQLPPYTASCLLFAAFRNFDVNRDDASITALFNNVQMLLKEFAMVCACFLQVE